MNLILMKKKLDNGLVKILKCMIMMVMVLSQSMKLLNPGATIIGMKKKKIIMIETEVVD